MGGQKQEWDVAKPKSASEQPRNLCRVYCSLLRTELGPLLQQTLDTDQRFFALFGAVCQLGKVTLRWAPSTLGELLRQSSCCTIHVLSRAVSFPDSAWAVQDLSVAQDSLLTWEEATHLAFVGGAV